MRPFEHAFENIQPRVLEAKEEIIQRAHASPASGGRANCPTPDLAIDGAGLRARRKLARMTDDERSGAPRRAPAS